MPACVQKQQKGHSGQGCIHQVGPGLAAVCQAQLVFKCWAAVEYTRVVCLVHLSPIISHPLQSINICAMKVLNINHTNFILTCSSRALVLYKYPNFLVQTTNTVVTLSYRSISYLSLHLAAGLLHHSISHASTALLMATALFYNTNTRLMCLNGICVLFLFPIEFRYRCMQGFTESLQHTAYTGTQLDKMYILHNRSLSRCKL